MIWRFNEGFQENENRQSDCYLQNRKQIGKNIILIFSLTMENGTLLLVFFHHYITFTEDMYEIHVLEKYIIYESSGFILLFLEMKTC